MCTQYYILSGAALATALSPVAKLIQWTLLDGHVSGSVNVKLLLQRFPDYFALMVINFAILAAALSIVLRLIGAKDGTLAAALAAAVATSDMVHGLFWTQHPMFMNVIVPPGFIFYFVWGCRMRETSYATIIGFGLAAAACILIYSLTMLWLPAFVLGALYRDWRMDFDPGRHRQRTMARSAHLRASRLRPGSGLARDQYALSACEHFLRGRKSENVHLDG